jgi:glutathione synthase/RimK-type ligase-like ATP-grasp enzyme
MIYFLSCYKQPNLPPKEINAVNLLREHNFKTEIVFWDEIDTDTFTNQDVIFLRSTWNYDQKPQAFIQFLNELKAKNIPVINYLETILWNLNKKYMFEFQEKNLAVIPTFHTFEKTKLVEQFPDCNRIIAKPFFSAGARGLVSMTKNEWLENTLPDTYICQPFVESVPELGEWSLIYFDGNYSHSVLKKPKTGDFRVQSDHGGTVTYVDVPKDWITLGESFLNACPQNPFFARVDLVIWENNPVLIELEVIEPELFVTDEIANQNYCKAILMKAKSYLSESQFKQNSCLSNLTRT